MSKTRKKHVSKDQAGSPPVLLFVLGAFLVLGAALWIAFSSSASSGVGPARISVDREVIDFGDVKMGVPVTATFKVTNTGGEPVRFTEEPYIELREGC